MSCFCKHLGESCDECEYDNDLQSFHEFNWTDYPPKIHGFCDTCEKLCSADRLGHYVHADEHVRDTSDFNKDFGGFWTHRQYYSPGDTITVNGREYINK